MRSTRAPKTESGGQAALLPKEIEKVGVSPLKCQGIKTRLVRFIAENVAWQGRGRWIEPFLGSAVVLFNLAPPCAIVSDTNVHIIRFFRDIQSEALHEDKVRSYLVDAGRELSKHGQRYYNEIRERFNRHGGSFDFLFLNRSCYNGMMRFNRGGEFNVPFGHKPNRFRKAYITKIFNQIAWVRKLMRGKNWIFRVADWKNTVAEARSDDFVYMDPPYIGRHTGYYNSWTLEEAEQLSETARELPCGFALSMWKENRYRKNAHLENRWSGLCTKTQSHFYHVGPTEALRNAVVEALIVKPGYAAQGEGRQ